MDLPNDSIGITDILAHRECGRRMSFGMKRHVGAGAQNQAGTMPEASQFGAVWARHYGSAIHTAIQAVEEGFEDEVAIQVAWNAYGHQLEPGDVQLMRDDLAIYRGRDYPQTRTVASEDEFRVPLMKHRGKQIWFRFKLDRLYERLDAPGVFIHVDYKSSRHAKSAKEVRDDQQLWAYNWAIHEYWPEVENLAQIYDQLRYGQEPTRKTHEARTRIKDWLVAAATSVIEDEAWQDDGLLEPRKNEWCAYCPIMESCPIIGQLTDWSLVEIATLAPAEKVGRKTVINLEPGREEEYVAAFAEAKQAITILERFRDAVTTLLKNAPALERGRLGYELRERRKSTFTPVSKERLHETLGERFYELAGVSKTALTEALEDDPVTLEWALGLADTSVGASTLLPVQE